MIRRLAAKLLVRLSSKRDGRPPYAFHDTNGRAYYAWTDIADMPRARRLEVDAIMLWIDAGRPKEAIAEIGDLIKSSAMKALEAKTAKDKGTALAHVVKLADELLLRGEIVPEDLAIQLCAATCVREDESDPATIDRSIHSQKINDFKAAGRAGHAFFTTPISRASLGALYSTDEAWRKRVAAWISEEARMRAVRRLCSSERESEG